MKLFRNIIITLSTICLCAYLACYLIIPYFLNKGDYSDIISSSVKKQTDLDLRIKHYKINVSPRLNIEIEADDICLFYPDKKQILDLKKVKLDFSTLALLKKEIKLQEVNAQKVQVSAKLLKNGKFSLQEYLEKNYKEDKSSPLKISDEIPNIKINELLIKLKDERTGQKFKFDTKNIKINKAILSSNIQISGNGDFYCANEKHFDYKLKLTIPEKMIREFKLKPIKITFENLQKHKIRATIDTDLRLTQDKSNKLIGKINIDNFSMYTNGTKLPPSYFHFLFAKNRGALDSQFFAALNERAFIKAEFAIGNSPYIYLKCNTKKISLTNLKAVLVSLSDIFNQKNNLSDFEMTGYIMSDFEVETDLKTVNSHGKLNVKNSELKHKKIPLRISSINADIDFSDNEIKINQSRLLVNAQPVELKGTIDKNAYGNITLSAKKLNLTHLMNAFSFLKPSKDVTVQSGTLSFSAVIKGKLNKATPKIDAVVNDFCALIKSDTLSIVSINADIKNANEKHFDGLLAINEVKYKIKELPSYIIASQITGSINEKDFILKPSKFAYDKASVTVEGSVSGYSKNPVASLTMFGTIDTTLLKSFVPKEVVLYSKGILPLGARIQSKSNVTNIQANILATPNAYITPILIKNLNNTLMHIEAELKNDNLSLKECSLNYPPASMKLSNEIKTDKLKKIIEISGNINNIKNPQFSGLKILIPNNLYFSVPPLKSAAITSDILLNGTMKAPDVQGTLSLSDVMMPMLYIKKLDIAPQKNIITVKVNTAKIDNMFFNLDAILKSDFLTTKKINNVNISSDKIDFDSLAKLSQLMPEAGFSPENNAQFDIISGKIKINSAKLNQIKLQNLTSDLRLENNILYLDNLRANAYKGNLAAKITYNIPYSSTHAIIQARGLESSMAAIDMIPVDAHISGRLNFDSDITMSGMSQAQQLKSLKGVTNVLISNAQLGPLGRFEHFLHAQNLLSQRLIFASLNSAKRALAPKNTGYVNSLKAVLKFNNGVVYLSPLTTSGPQMSMHVTGVVNMLTNMVDVQILGRVSPDVSDSVGVLGDVTIKNILDEHTIYGPAIAKLFTEYNLELPEVDISKIPALSSKYALDTKNFRVLIVGDPESVKSIQSFTWVNPIGTQAEVSRKKFVIVNPEKAQETRLKQILQMKGKPEEIPQDSLLPEQKPAVNVQQNKPAGFLDNIPDTFR